MTAPGDPIQISQSLPGNPHGADPDTAPGVTRMDTGYFGDGNDPHQRRLVAGLAGHGKYWDDPNSDAFANIVRVVTGDEPTPYVFRRHDNPVVEALDQLDRIVHLGDVPLRLGR